MLILQINPHKIANNIIGKIPITVNRKIEVLFVLIFNTAAVIIP